MKSKWKCPLIKDQFFIFVEDSSSVFRFICFMEMILKRWLCLILPSVPIFPESIGERKVLRPIDFVVEFSVSEFAKCDSSAFFLLFSSGETCRLLLLLRLLSGVDGAHLRARDNLCPLPVWSLIENSTKCRIKRTISIIEHRICIEKISSDSVLKRKPQGLGGGVAASLYNNIATISRYPPSADQNF